MLYGRDFLITKVTRNRIPTGVDQLLNRTFRNPERAHVVKTLNATQVDSFIKELNTKPRTSCTRASDVLVLRECIEGSTLLSLDIWEITYRDLRVEPGFDQANTREAILV